ncbi:MAG TPA: hypothetical protein VFF04_05445 [Candidatus Babeliales bacterium]|nr:hypothetical protein [Candidatus Babeliales bacterium]
MINLILLLISGLVSNNVWGAELEQAPHSVSVPLLPIADQTRPDSTNTRTRDYIKELSKGQKICCLSCLGCCGIGCLAVALYIFLNGSGSECILDHNCLPATTSLRESCFGMNVCQEPKQVFCPYPGTVGNISSSDQARFFLKKADDKLCIKKISCKDLSCSKQKQD